MKLKNRVEIYIADLVTTVDFSINTKQDSLELYTTQNNKKELKVKIPKGKRMQLVLEVLN